MTTSQLKLLPLLIALLVFPALNSLRAATLPPGFVEITVATGFTNASVLAVAPDGRVFVGQQNGVVRVIKQGALLPVPFVALPATTRTDQGLYGFTFDPGFSSNNFVYVSYTATNSAAGGSYLQRISRLTAEGDTALPGSATNLLETDGFTAEREVGGGLHFGPDGFLYIGLGQSGSSANAQSLGNLFGKILRLNRDGTIPSDNPFFNQAAGKNRAIWALGLRNPFAFSFQAGTGRLLINDVGGNSSREEINEGAAGTNYGWPTCEGPCNPANPNLRNPLYSYLSSAPALDCAITGGTFYSPPVALFPASYVGKYFFSDYCSGTIYQLDPATGLAAPFATNAVGSLVALAVGPEGALYYLSRSPSPAQGGGAVGMIVPGAQTVLPFASAWKYLDTGVTNLDLNWVQPVFDDSGWSNGVAPFGWGGNGETTTVRSNRTDNSRIITTFFRRPFLFPDSAPYSNLVVSLLRDDGAAVYFNGVEVFRNNLPAGLITATNLALIAVPSADERVTYAGAVNPALIRPGTNLLAVEIHQQSITGGTDMSFDLALMGITNRVALSATLSGGGLVLSYPAWAGRFVLESTTNVPSAFWNTVATNGTTTLSNQLQVPVSAEGGPQFFRLRSP